MTTKRISNYKIESVSKIISSEKYNEKIEKLKESIGHKVDNYLKQFIPKDVLKLHEKYSYYMCKGPFIGLYSKDGYEFTHYPTLPKLEEKYRDHKFREDKDFIALIERDVEELKDLRIKKNSLKNKVSCVLSDLKTYTKIKNDFPEAYSILIEKVDGQKEVKDTCTEVESLRAELNIK